MMRDLVYAICIARALEASRPAENGKESKMEVMFEWSCCVPAVAAMQSTLY